MEKLLSNYDVSKIVGKHVPMILYDDLANYNRIQDLFRKGNNVLILVRASDNCGHWIGLKYLNKNEIDYWDPYGDNVDVAIDYSPLGYSNELSRLLLKFLNEDERNSVYYQSSHLQRDGNGVNTCGRWASLFFKCGINVDEISSVVEEVARRYGIGTDELVTIYTNQFL